MAGFTATRRGFAPSHSERLTLRQLPPSTVTDASRFSVVSNGAKGDFAADDTAAFQATIAQAQANGGGVPFVPEGHYKLTAQLAVTASYVVIDTAPGAILDYSASNIGTPASISLSGSDGAVVNLTNDVAAGDQFVRVAAGSEPADGAWVRLASNGFWAGGLVNATSPPIDSAGLSSRKGEHRQVSMPTGTLSIGMGAADTSLTIDNTLTDARVGNRWPANASVRIGAEDIPYTTATVTTNTVVLAGLVRGGGATTHLAGAGVALTPGYVGLKAPADDSYAVADAAWINTETLLEQVGITGAGRIVGPGFNKGANAVNFDRCTHILSSPHLTYTGWDRAAVYLSDVVETDFYAPHVVGGKSNSNEFYGIATQWAAQDITIFGGTMEDVRHAFTTSGATSRSGVSRRIDVVGMHGNNNTSNSFDTHPSGEDIAFFACASKNSAAQGFNIRNPSSKIMGCSVKDAQQYGARMRNESFKPTRYIVDGLTIDGAGNTGLLVAPDGQYTTLRSTILIGDTPPFSITVDATSPWTAGVPLQIDSEWFTWTVLDATHFTITARAQNGSAAAGHAITAQVLNGFHGTGASMDYVDLDNVVVQRAGLLGSSASVNIYSADTFAYSNVHIGKLVIKDQVGSGSAGLLMQNVQNSTVDRVLVLNHPAAANGVDLQNCVDTHVRGRVEYASRSTGQAFRVRSAWPWGPAPSNCTIELPQSVNAGTGIKTDNTCTSIRLRAIEGVNEATTPISDAGTGTIFDPTAAASRAFGTATLAAGTSGSIANTAITATSLIRLTNIGVGGTVGVLSVALAAGVGFTVNSSSNTDTSKVFWEIVRF